MPRARSSLYPLLTLCALASAACSEPPRGDAADPEARTEAGTADADPQSPAASAAAAEPTAAAREPARPGGAGAGTAAAASAPVSLMMELGYPTAFRNELYRLSSEAEPVTARGLAESLAERGRIRVLGEEPPQSQLVVWVTDAQGRVASQWTSEPFANAERASVGEHLDVERAATELREHFGTDRLYVRNSFFPDGRYRAAPLFEGDDLSEVLALLQPEAGTGALILMPMPASPSGRDATLAGAAVLVLGTRPGG